MKVAATLTEFSEWTLPDSTFVLKEAGKSSHNFSET